jgi:hypothetical protein
MQKLEIYDQFKKLFGEQLNPKLFSVKYCQSETKSIIELYFKSDSTPTIINLAFIGGKIIIDQDGINKDILPLFEPKDDIIDNAKRLIKLDNYSLINCIDGLLTEEASNKINNDYIKILGQK